MRILGIDYGSTRVGLALGDTDSGIASALMVLQEKDLTSVIDRISALAHEEGIRHVVVGIPHPLGDQTRDTAQVASIRRFIARLVERGLEVEEADETLSSQLAMQQVHEMGQKKKRDDLAAAIILQSWLDKK